MGEFNVSPVTSAFLARAEFVILRQIPNVIFNIALPLKENFSRVILNDKNIRYQDDLAEGIVNGGN